MYKEYDEEDEVRTYLPLEAIASKIKISKLPLEIHKDNLDPKYAGAFAAAELLRL